MKTSSEGKSAAPACDICGGQGQLRRVSGNKFWCTACGHLQS